jgi:hypothetical protein
VDELLGVHSPSAQAKAKEEAAPAHAHLLNLLLSNLSDGTATRLRLLLSRRLRRYARPRRASYAFVR